MSGASPTFSVAICCYTERRWDQLIDAIASAQAQTLEPLEVLVVVDHNPLLEERLRGAVNGPRVIANRYERGLSGGRNTAVDAARGSVVAFLDDDAEAAPTWLEAMAPWYDDPEVLGLGGRVNPDWGPLGRPSAFPPEFDWVVGCSYVGLPTHSATIRNPIGANMSIRVSVFESVGGFRSSIGRVGTRPLGCEETELCIRATQRLGGRFVYEPAAEVRHHVDPSRRTLHYFVNRCYSEGISKAVVARMVGGSDATRAERSFVGRVLARAAAREMTRAVLRLDAGALARGLRIVLGTAAAASGYGFNRLAGLLSPQGSQATISPTLDRSEGS